MKQCLITILTFILPIVCWSQDSMSSQKSFGLTIGLPWVNSYSYYEHDLQASKNKSGFGGLEVSFFHKQNKNKVSFNAGVTVDLPAPIGPIDFAKEGTRTVISALYMEGLYHKNLYRGLNIIGGINFINYRFGFISYVDSLPGYYKNDKTIGITSGLEYSLFKNIALGFFYRPTLFSFDTKQYKHLISLDLRFDIDF